MYIVYKHTSKTSGKSCIGFTSYSLEKRFAAHISHAFNTNQGSYNNHFQKAIRKYGADDFTSDILKIFKYKKSALKYESKMIIEHNTLNEGYNMTHGGECRSDSQSYVVYDPYNKKLTITNVKQFITDNNINQSNFYMMLSGVIPHIKGYSLKPQESTVRDSYYPVTFQHKNGMKITLVDSTSKNEFIKNNFKYKQEFYKILKNPNKTSRRWKVI